MPCEVPHHIGTTIQSLSVAGPLLAEAGAFLGDVGLLYPVTLAWGLSISFAKTSFKLRTNQRLLLLKLPSSLLHRSKTCIVIWWLPHSPLLFLHFFFQGCSPSSISCMFNPFLAPEPNIETVTSSYVIVSMVSVNMFYKASYERDTIASFIHLLSS